MATNFWNCFLVSLLFILIQTKSSHGRGLFERIQDEAGKLASSVGDEVKSWEDGIGSIFDNNGGKSWNDGLGNFKDGIESGVGDLKDGIESGVGDLKDGIESGVGDLKDRIESGVGNVKDNIESGLGNVKDNIESGLGNVKDNIESGLGNVKDGIGSGIDDGLNKVKDGIGSGIDELNKWKDGIGSDIGDGLNKAKDGIGSGIGDGLNKAKDEIGSGIDGLNKWKDGVGSGIGDDLNKWKDGIGSGIGDGLNKWNDGIQSGHGNGGVNPNWPDHDSSSVGFPKLPPITDVAPNTDVSHKHKNPIGKLIDGIHKAFGDKFKGLDLNINKLEKGTFDLVHGLFSFKLSAFKKLGELIVNAIVKVINFEEKLIKLKLTVEFNLIKRILHGVKSILNIVHKTLALKIKLYSSLFNRIHNFGHKIFNSSAGSIHKLKHNLLTLISLINKVINCKITKILLGGTSMIISIVGLLLPLPVRAALIPALTVTKGLQVVGVVTKQFQDYLIRHQ